MRIELTDNNRAGERTYARSDVAELFPIANKTIAELCRENDNLLVLPHSIEHAEDKVGDLHILTLQNTYDPEAVSLKTGNVMGFFGKGDLQVKIKSRFDIGRDDYFLHYMLRRVLRLNIFSLNHDSEDEDLFELRALLFPLLLNGAMRQGLYREYKSYRHNDANLRGTIEIGRHVTRNIPFVGNVAYATREYSHDNCVTQLVRHTIEHIKTKRFGQFILNADSDTTANVKDIVSHTPSYCKGERRTVISKNIRLKRHPYYTAYQPLQRLCLQILTDDNVKYGETDDAISGILFDGAWLWEEYLHTLLKSQGFKHPENKRHKGGISLFEDNSGIRYPDFHNPTMVLDAKYKRVEQMDRVSQMDRDDIHQIIAYTANLKTPLGGFIAPMTRKQLPMPKAKLKSPAAIIFIAGIEVSQSATSYKEFCEAMRQNEESFLNSLSQLQGAAWAL